MLDDQLVVTWPKVCQAVGTEFEKYLSVVMPPLIDILGDGTLSAYIVGAFLINFADEPQTLDWMSLISRHLQQDNVKRSNATGHDKLQAFELLIIYCSILQARFAPYLPRCLELTLSSLCLPSVQHFRDVCISWVFIFSAMCILS